MEFSEKAQALCGERFGHGCPNCPEELRAVCGCPFHCPPNSPERKAEEAAYIKKFNEIAERS